MDVDLTPDGSIPVYVLYHAGCMDGFGSAWAAWLVLGDTAKYLPVQYGMRPPFTELGARIFILDFSYPADDLLDLAERSCRVTVLDHHQTAQKQLEGLDGASYGALEVRFDLAKSGAMLAWEYFHPGVEPPALIRYVQDRDLWIWALPLSKAFNCELRASPQTFESWTLIHQGFEDATKRGISFRRRFYDRGMAVVTHVDSIVDGLCNKAITIWIAGHAVPCVNSQGYQSEIGDALCLRRPAAPFAAIWYGPDLTSRIWSLRSRSGFPVNQVAEVFGGGGHQAAAAFRAGVDQNIAAPPEGYEPPEWPPPQPEDIQ